MNLHLVIFMKYTRACMCNWNKMTFTWMLLQLFISQEGNGSHKCTTDILRSSSSLKSNQFQHWMNEHLLYSWLLKMGKIIKIYFFIIIYFLLKHFHMYGTSK